VHCNVIAGYKTERPPRGGLSEIRSGVLIRRLLLKRRSSVSFASRAGSRPLGPRSNTANPGAHRKINLPVQERPLRRQRRLAGRQEKSHNLPLLGQPSSQTDVRISIDRLKTVLREDVPMLAVQTLTRQVGGDAVTRPACPNCGRSMHMTRITPGMDGLPEVGTFRCGECGVSIFAAISQRKAGEWIQP
jgi:predicted RNA-binding Zn-ribbon protein involved in translation (DUF1610 family)